jgi:ribosomal protein L37AE/L43A
MTCEPGDVFALYAIVGLFFVAVLWCRDVALHRRGHRTSMRTVVCPVCGRGVKLERNMGRLRCRSCGVRFDVATLANKVPTKVEEKKKL